MNVELKISILEKNADLLLGLLEEIPEEILKDRRIKNKWSIHEHVCHLYEAQKMMMKRFMIFKNEKEPVFKPYLPGSKETPDNHLLDMDLKQCLSEFMKERLDLVKFLKTFDHEDWNNNATHPEYRMFTAEVFLRHILMHDHLHMYRIEELWLTNDEYLPN